MKILIADDDRQNRQMYAAILESVGFECVTASNAEDAYSMLTDTPPPDLIISDVCMPGESGIELLKQVRAIKPFLPFLIITAYASVRQAVEALKFGAVDYLEKPIDLNNLVDAAREALGVGEHTHVSGVPKNAMHGILTRNPFMLQTYRDAYVVASSDAPILITGESGTGKNVLAKFIQENSKRSNAPFVTINCASIPANLIASELFGHCKGAFTGASEKRRGKIREADKGTLFLDEIGDLPLDLQPALLRALETGKITPVGSDHEMDIDFRLIAATNHNLMTETITGKFRKDLFYRINVISFELRPLRKCPEDILPLAQYFLTREGAIEKRISPAAARALTGYSWPGNIRELANAMARAHILSSTNIILPEHLPPTIINPRNAAPKLSAGDTHITTLEESEKQSIMQALKQTESNRTRAAELLGISRRALLYKLQRYNLTEF